MSDNVTRFFGGGKRGTVRRIVLFVLLLAVVLTALVLIVFRDRINLDAARRYIRYLNVSEADREGRFVYDDNNSNRYSALAEGLVVASNAGVSAFDRNGSELVSLQLQMSVPTLEVADVYALAYDAGGHELRQISQSQGAVLSITTERPILDAAVAADGSACYLTSQSGYKSVLCVYNTEHSLAFRWFSSSMFLMRCAVSPKAQYAAAVSLGQSDGMFESGIQIFRTTQEEIQQSILFGNELIYDLAFVRSDLLMAVGEKHVRFYALDGTLKGEYSYADAYLKDFTISGSGFLTLVLNMYRAGNSYKLVTVGYDGAVLGEQDISEQILDICSAGRYVSILTSRRLTIYDSALREYAAARNETGASSAVVCADGTAIFLSGGKGTRLIP